MGKVFRPSNREARILSRIESGKEHQRRMALQKIPDVLDPLSNALAQKLVENGIVETTNKNSLEEEFRKTLDALSRSDEFEVDYMVAPLRRLTRNPHIVSLYLTAFVVETLINHRDVIDIFGDDLEVYQTIHRQVGRFLP